MALGGMAVVRPSSVARLTSRPIRRSASSTSRVVRASPRAELETLELQPIKSIDGTVKLPGSKSLSNRILLLAALAEGTTVVENLLDSDDIRYMVDAFGTLGVEFDEEREANRITVTGYASLFDTTLR
jgi:3-phosphoshikimate 1-carboxyvinyltransferase